MQSKQISIGHVAAKLAEQLWAWNRQCIEASLQVIGFSNVESFRHRLTYVDQEGLLADVYCDGDKVDCVEVTVSTFTEVDSLTDIEYDDKVDEYYDAFLAATKDIVSHLGKPVFSDGAAAAGFPDDQDAVWLSLWMMPSCRLMLQQKHEDRELPFRLCVVVAPK